MKINRTKILKYVESQYPFIDDTEKLALAESMLNYFRNNVKKSYGKFKKFINFMDDIDKTDEENLSEGYSPLLKFLLSSNDPKIRDYARAIYINTMRSPERNQRAANMELKRQGISDLGDVIQNPQKYGIRANNVTGIFDSGKPNKQYSESIKKYKLKKVK